MKINNEQLNLSTRKFLKYVGVTSQQKIEEFVNKAVQNNRLSTNKVHASIKLVIEELGLEHEIKGEIIVSDENG